MTDCIMLSHISTAVDKLTSNVLQLLNSNPWVWLVQEVAPLAITGSNLTDSILYCVNEIEVVLDVGWCLL